MLARYARRWSCSAAFLRARRVELARLTGLGLERPSARECPSRRAMRHEYSSSASASAIAAGMKLEAPRRVACRLLQHLVVSCADHLASSSASWPFSVRWTTALQLQLLPQQQYTWDGATSAASSSMLSSGEVHLRVAPRNSAALIAASSWPLRGGQAALATAMSLTTSTVVALIRNTVGRLESAHAGAVAWKGTFSRSSSRTSRRVVLGGSR